MFGKSNVLPKAPTEVWCSESFGFSPARVGEVLTALACLVPWSCGKKWGGGKPWLKLQDVKI